MGFETRSLCGLAYDALDCTSINQNCVFYLYIKIDGMNENRENWLLNFVVPQNICADDARISRLIISWWETFQVSENSWCFEHKFEHKFVNSFIFDGKKNNKTTENKLDFEGILV